ncbi:hypothetical protein ACFFRR_001362 [Megaselia abdita]
MKRRGGLLIITYRIRSTFFIRKFPRKRFTDLTTNLLLIPIPDKFFNIFLVFIFCFLRFRIISYFAFIISAFKLNIKLYKVIENTNGEAVETSLAALEKPPIYDDLEIEAPTIAEVRAAIVLLRNKKQH